MYLDKNNIQQRSQSSIGVALYDNYGNNSLYIPFKVI